MITVIRNATLKKNTTFLVGSKTLLPPTVLEFKFFTVALSIPELIITSTYQVL